MAKHTHVGTYASFNVPSGVFAKLDKMEADITKVMSEAVQQASIPMRRDMIAFMKKHEKTGTTLKAFHQGKAVWDGDFMQYGFGWRTDDGGLPTLFLDLGTPKIKPSFFTYYARRNNEDQFNRMVVDYLNRFVMGVWE